jgi:hypothetical protein
MLQWYRATVEHTIGYIKRYKILGSIYRGRVVGDVSELSNAVKIIIHLAAYHVKDHQRRTHHNLLNGVDIDDVPDLSDDEGDNNDEDGAAQAPVNIPFDGFDEQTFDPAVGTALTHETLDRGMRVEVYMSGTWWLGRITRVYGAINRVNVKLVGANTVTRDIMPKHVRFARVG